MVQDHVGIDRHLAASEGADGSIHAGPYTAFRQDLLRHIGMEEKVLLPYARLKRQGEPLALSARLRADHGALARLLARPPTPTLLAEIREILGRHNPLEEGADGLYAACDLLAGSEGLAVVDRLRAQPDVPLAKHFERAVTSSR